jgi:antitoxin (DNA-binding transcriptional repressor) of toxin-antitoxin stability system
MKKVTVEEFARQAAALLATAQRERVIVMKNGKPLAQLVGIVNKDAEDLALEEDEAFWQMIRERRKETKTIPFAEVKKQLGLGGTMARKRKARTQAAPARKSSAKR